VKRHSSTNFALTQTSLQCKTLMCNILSKQVIHCICALGVIEISCASSDTCKRTGHVAVHPPASTLSLVAEGMP